MTQRIFGVAGWKNFGSSTTLVEKLGEANCQRALPGGYGVKHAHHSFDIDHEGTDPSATGRGCTRGWRSSRDGCGWGLVHEIGEMGRMNPGLSADTCERLSPSDLVIVEGYKGATHHKKDGGSPPRRTPKGTAGTGRSNHTVAIAADHRSKTQGLPVFDLDDVGAIADFVVTDAGSDTPSDSGPGRSVHLAEVGRFSGVGIWGDRANRPRAAHQRIDCARCRKAAQKASFSDRTALPARASTRRASTRNRTSNMAVMAGEADGVAPLVVAAARIGELPGS